MRAVAFLVAFVASVAQAASPYVVPPPLNALTGNLRLSISSWVFESARTSDAAAYALYLAGGNAWSQATGASQTGASVYVVGGIGTRQVTCSTFGANAAGDTWTPTINMVAGQVLTARNGGAVANEWNCDTSNANCCVNLKTAVNAQSYNVTASCIDGTCSDGKVYLTPSTPSVWGFTQAIADAGGGAFGTATSGADGQALLPSGSTALPGLSFAGDPDTGIQRYGANAFYLVSNGTAMLGVTSSGLNLGTILNTNAQKITDTVAGIGFSPAAYTKGQATSIAGSSQVLTFAANPGDASKVTSGLIPDGAVLVGVTSRVTTAGSNCTSISIGDGTDVDMFGATLPITLAATSDNSNATAQFAMSPATAAKEVTVTANGGNCYNLVIRITAHYITVTAPTSN